MNGWEWWDRLAADEARYARARKIVRIAGWPLAAIAALSIVAYPWIEQRLHPPFGPYWPWNSVALTGFVDKLSAGLTFLAFLVFTAWFLGPYVTPAFIESDRSRRLRERAFWLVSVLGMTVLIATAVLFLELVLVWSWSDGNHLRWPMPLPNPEAVGAVALRLSLFLPLWLVAAILRRAHR